MLHRRECLPHGECLKNFQSNGQLDLVNFWNKGEKMAESKFHEDGTPFWSGVPVKKTEQRRTDEVDSEDGDGWWR